ncbi:putative Poly(A) polymerase beta [Corchorus olitorius]|uniref:Poly(A) polymerase beta n=1 Tax=Corchorus olitorius TaxID=93759 RepID=A0A1R3JDG6_9ROSI|nr:putative Poly(A) polymerase beta [Corchorus olitorius]
MASHGHREIMTLKASRATFLIESCLYESIEEALKREEVLGHINELEILILVSWESKAAKPSLNAGR